MNAKTITSALIAAVLGFSLGLPATALADDDRGHRRGHGHHDDHGYRHHRRHHKRHKHHGHRKHHKKHHYGRHYGYAPGYYGGYYDDDDDEDLLIGLVVGGILGYALNESRHGNYDDEGFYDQNAYQPPPASRSTCLQEREYQTTVIVGGRPVDAYGTACLQPDGSWTRSPPRVASY